MLGPAAYPRASDDIAQIIGITQRSDRPWLRLRRRTATSSSRRAKSPDYGIARRPRRSPSCAQARELPNRREHKKRDPLDFLLWQVDPATRVGTALGSRPARLDIECTAMSTRSSATRSTSTAAARTSLFPHHESEIAQAECATGQAPFCALLDAQRHALARWREDERSRSATSSSPAT